MRVGAILSLALIVALVVCTRSFDSFAHHELTLSTDRATYSPGEPIELIATIRPPSPGPIHLHTDRSRSFFLYVRCAVDGRPDLADGPSWSPRRTERRRGEPSETVVASPEEPYSLTIQGRVESGPGNVVLDFGEFGRFSKERCAELLVGGFWLPVNPNPVDSLEDYTNSVLVRVRKMPG